MRTYPSILLVLTLLSGPVAGSHAATVPYVGLGQQPPPEDEPAGRPDLTELEARWWRFFEVEGRELQQRIQETITRLEELPAQLPIDAAGTARPLIARIRNNLLALPAARAKPSPAPPLPAVYRERYTVAQLLDLARRQRQIEAELEASRYEVASADGAIKTAQRRIDTLMAAYLGFEPTSPERVLRSLEIMADYSEMALAEEQLRVSQATLQAQQILLGQLIEEQAAATERLYAEYADFGRLSEELAQARSALAQAQERLNAAQARVAQARAASPEPAGQRDEANVRYLQQQAVHAAVAEALERVHVDRLQAERLLVLLVLDLQDIRTPVLRAQVAAIGDRLAEVGAEIGIWSGESERERNRAGEAMAHTAEDDAAAALNQARLNLAQQTLVALQRLKEALVVTELLLQQADRRVAQREGWLRTWLVQAEQGFRKLQGSADEWLKLSLFKIGTTPVTALGLLKVVLVFFVFWGVSYGVRRMLIRLGRKREGVSQSALYTIGRLSHYVIITLGFFIGLSVVGIDFTNLALVAGAIGIGVGFGLQSIVANFVAGLILLFERSLKVGDFVELASGVAGEVRAINVRSTVINTNDNVDIVVPNSQFITSNVINWTLYEDFCRIHVPFKVAHGVDKDLVRKAALEAAACLGHTLRSRPASVWLADFADDGLAFELVVWITPAAVKRPGAVNADYRWEIESALRKHGIEIPLPQRDLRLRSDLKEFLQVLLSREAA